MPPNAEKENQKTIAPMYVDVILPLPLEGLFTYSVPQRLAGRVSPGVRVVVILGRSRKYVAMVSRVHDEKPEGFEVKSITDVIDSQPQTTDIQMRLWRWIADYYLSPIGEVYRAALPAGMKVEDGYKPRTELYIRLQQNFRSDRGIQTAFSMLDKAPRQREVLRCYLSLSEYAAPAGDMTATPQEEPIFKEVTREELMNSSRAAITNVNALINRGIMEIYAKEVGRLNDDTPPHPENIKTLNQNQQRAFDEIMLSWRQRDVTLLHGVTSSGKTEIYIHLIQRALDSGKQVLYLLPEIALTVQMMDRLRRVFGNRLGIYHSKYSDGERVEIWKKQLSDPPYDVILGARSAVFLPFRRLGLVIVDEEHENSYKQQEPMPRYHARSTAIMLATMCGAKTLLGTATPSLESYHNAMTGKFGLVELKERYAGIEMPEIKVVDTHDLRRRKMMRGPFSPLLLTHIREALDNGQQVILFQNRRGFAPMIECKDCGWVPRCEHCDVSLTLHRTMNQLTCHYCGHTYLVPTKCPECGSANLRGRGYGTEKIEDQISELFPEARVARMDLDTTHTRNAYERLIDDFAKGKTNILIGTQMISKGLDFDSVSVVGILDADAMLNYPDFRAYEQAFMMMSQVSGRAGRKGKRGIVILQTQSPTLPIIQQVVNNDYATMYRDTIEERQMFRYPPYHRLIYVYLKHRSAAVADSAAIEMGSRLRRWFGTRVLGPDKPAVAKVKAMNIRKIVLKLENGIDMPRVREYLRHEQNEMMKDKRHSLLQIYYDVDPQ